MAATSRVGDKRSRGLLARLGSWLGAGPAASPERGEGSLGNGGAMRVAPVGGYFADDLAAVIAKACASAEVTHAQRDPFLARDGEVIQGRE